MTNPTLPDAPKIDPMPRKDLAMPPPVGFVAVAYHNAQVAALTAERDALRDEVHTGDDFLDLVREARIEAARAMHKFPQPNYVISKVAEEAGEVVKAAIHMAENRETAENLRGEMKQLLAMLYRLWVEGDRVHGLPPVRDVLAKEATHDRP